MDLSPGDVVILHNDCSIPADILCLWSNETDQNVFVETKGLDGETNIKPKKSVSLIARMINMKVGTFSSTTVKKDSEFNKNLPDPHQFGYKVGFEKNNDDLGSF